MKKIKIIIICFLMISVIIQAKPLNTDNVAIDAQILGSTLPNAKALFDMKGTSYQESVIIDTSKQQTITFALSNYFYISVISFVWDRDKIPAYQIQLSSEDEEGSVAQEGKDFTIQKKYQGLYTIEELHFNGFNGAKNITITFLASDKPFKCRLGEIIVNPKTDFWTEGSIDTICTTDKETFLSLKTTTQTRGYIYIKETGAKTARRVAVTTWTNNHIIPLYNLKPNTSYSYTGEIIDRIANDVALGEHACKTISTNTLLGKKVSGTFTRYPPEDTLASVSGNPLYRINDDRIDYFKGMATSREITDEDQYVVFDLGKKQSIEKIVMYWRALAYSKQYDIQISDDAENWKTIHHNLDASDGFATYSPIGDPILVQEIASPSRSAGRYIRIVAAKNSPLYCFYPHYKLVQIMEIKVF